MQNRKQYCILVSLKTIWGTIIDGRVCLFVGVFESGYEVNFAGLWYFCLLFITSAFYLSLMKAHSTLNIKNSNP